MIEGSDRFLTRTFALAGAFGPLTLSALVPPGGGTALAMEPPARSATRTSRTRPERSASLTGLMP